MNKLIIGCKDANFLNDATKCLVGLCEEYEIVFELKSVSKNLEDALLRKEISTYSTNLMDFPFNYPEEIVIAGLSERFSFQALIESDGEQAPLLSSLNEISIAIREPYGQLLSAQLKYMFPDQSFTTDDTGTIASWKNVESTINQGIKMDVRDFIPPPGSGSYCFICLKNSIDVRRAIQKIHFPETAYCTNVERSFAKLYDPGPDELLAAHCFRDRIGHYHFHVFVKNSKNEAHKIHLSQSTFIKLAENALTKLRDEVPHF